MLEFLGQEECRLDEAGRFKLSAGLRRDFLRHTDGEVVLTCLPEGAIGIYPPAMWRAMWPEREERAARAGQSVLARRSMRRLGALSRVAAVSNQGRISIPPNLRRYAELEPGAAVMLVGCEVGAEIWNTERWQRELELIQVHLAHKEVQEMAGDLRERQ